MGALMIVAALALLPAWWAFWRGPRTKREAIRDYEATGVLTLDRPRSLWFYFSRGWTLILTLLALAVVAANTSPVLRGNWPFTLDYALAIAILAVWAVVLIRRAVILWRQARTPFVLPPDGDRHGIERINDPRRDGDIGGLHQISQHPPGSIDILE